MNVLKVLIDEQIYNIKDIASFYLKKCLKLSKNRDFFKQFKPESNILFGKRLPKINFNDYDFDNVNIEGCIFHKKSILPEDKNFFQKLYKKSLLCCKLPEGDYSKFNFSGVDVSNIEFRKNSILPDKYNFFNDVIFRFSYNIQFPDYFFNNCHLYNLTDIDYLSRKHKYLGYVNIYQYFILYKKYGDKIHNFNLKIKHIN